MQFFTPDGTRLTYRRAGTGAPLVCVPGGPLLPADYLGDLGRLTDYAELILLDPRGSGHSAPPVAPATCRCDLVADDLEALWLHLELERLDLLGPLGRHQRGSALRRAPPREDRSIGPRHSKHQSGGRSNQRPGAERRREIPRR